MASSKVASKSKPGIEKQQKQQISASTETGTVKRATAGRPATTAKKTSTVKKRTVKTGKKSSRMTPEERDRIIAVAAYYRAEQRGFQCKCSERDWLDASAEIDSRM